MFHVFFLQGKVSPHAAIARWQGVNEFEAPPSPLRDADDLIHVFNC
jgi:hypothetical protein